MVQNPKLYKKLYSDRSYLLSISPTSSPPIPIDNHIYLFIYYSCVSLMNRYILSLSYKVQHITQNLFSILVFIIFWKYKINIFIIINIFMSSHRNLFFFFFCFFIFQLQSTPLSKCTQFIQLSPICEPSGYCQYFAITNNAATNNLVYVLSCIVGGVFSR